jgi:uncharacterized protein YggE
MKVRSILFLLAAVMAPLVTRAQRTITVVGDGSVEAKPDYAMVTMMVSAQDQTAQGVFARCEDAGTALRKAITGTGVAANDIEQQGTALSPSYDYSGGGGAPPHLAGYHLMVTYQIRVRSLREIPKVIDAGTLAGASNVAIGSYGVANKDEMEQSATKKALAEAREKAERLAEQMGGKLGAIISIGDGDATGVAAGGGGGREEEEERRGVIVSGNNPQKIRKSATLKVTFSVQ